MSKKEETPKGKNFEIKFSSGCTQVLVIFIIAAAIVAIVFIQT